MERVVEINIGDWSQDGHNQYKSYFVTVSGDDVSDSAFQDSYNTMVKILGKELSEICDNYEESSISASFYSQLLEAGFTSSASGPFPWLTVEDAVDRQGQEVEISALELVMFYLGNAIPDFSYTVLNAPILVGGGRIQEANGHSVSFGYGLFFS